MVAQRQAAPRPMTTAEIAALTPQQRAQYFSSLPQGKQLEAQQALVAYINQQNRDYMKRTVRKKSVCPPSSGSGQSQTYAPQLQLTYNAPAAIDGFLEGFIIRLNLKVDIATGTSAVYAATAARELALIRELVVNYQGTQFKVKPYILRELRRMQGIYMPSWPDDVLASANEIASLTSYMSQGALPVGAGTNQAVNIWIYVPLNLLHPQDVRGLLPIDGESTTCQIILETATALLGNDPAKNVWYAVSGSGHAVTLTSGQSQTAQVIAVYRDGLSMTQRDSLPIQFGGVGTVQMQNDVDLTGFSAGNIFRQKITKLEQHYYALLTVIDAKQSNLYCDVDNITYLDLVTDETGSHAFWKVGTGTNLSVYEWFTNMRELLRQDLTEGIVPLVYAPIYAEADPDNLNGAHILNCDPARGGWSAVHYGIQLNDLSSPVSGVTPRVECHLVWVNPQGLVAST